jgi:hypothetical protein
MSSIVDDVMLSVEGLRAFPSRVTMVRIIVWKASNRSAIIMECRLVYDAILIFLCSIPLHSKHSPFDAQLCLANTAIFTSYIAFQSNEKKKIQPRQV